MLLEALESLEAPILWPPDAKSWLTGKDPDAGKDWRQKKGKAEVEMVGQHHQLTDMNSNKPWKIVKDRGIWRTAVYGVEKCQTQLSHWTTIKVRKGGEKESFMRH